MKLLRFLLFVIIINITLLSSNSMDYYIVRAGWLDDFKYDVCKLFNSEVTEKWEGDDPVIEKLMKKNASYYIDQHGESPYRGKRSTTDLNCSPPWNRYTGRTGCLLKYPVNGLGLTLSNAMYCAEAVNDNASNSAKIRVRAQLCNTFACWVIDDVLTHGKCSLFAGSWGINPVRLCARIAYPNTISYQKAVADAKDDINEDPSCKYDSNDEPGYTRCIHVDEQGRQRVDQLIEVLDKNTNEKKKKRILAPKLCLYNDPWLYKPGMLLAVSPVGMLAAFGSIDDPFDWDPSYQIEHQHQYKFIKSPAYINALKKHHGKELSNEEIARLSINKSEVKKFNVDAGIVVSFIIKVVNNISNLIDKINTHYNNKVEPEILGCIELPLGVSPPPFYDTLDANNYKPDIKVQQICSLNQIKNVSTTINNDKSSGCIMSTIRNNVIHNSVRVAENNLLPLCPDNNSEETNAKFKAGECVKVSLPLYHNALEVHEKLKDNIPPCNESTSNTLCIMHNNASLVTKNFRILYTTVVTGDEEGYSALPQNFNYCIPLCISPTQCPAQSSKLLDHKTDCCSNFKGICQKIWGVNAGSYTDVVLDFTSTSTQSNNDKVLFNKFDFQGKKLMALITRKHIDVQPEFLSDPNSEPSNRVATILHKQKPEEICVYDVTSKHKLIGCVPRAARPIPIVKACDGGSGNHFRPKIGIQLAAKKSDANDDYDILKGCVEAKNIHNNTHANINLAGYDYSAYVTDAYDSVIDAGKTEILGEYHNTTNPKNDRNPIYLGGFEKINDAYVSGGKLICVDSNNIGHFCNLGGSELQRSLCVLSKKIKNSLSYSVENREDPKFDKKQCMPASKDYPKCLKLDENNYYKAQQEKIRPEILELIRTKNSLELGLCIKVPEMPDCKGLTDKYTIWSDAKVGEESIGKCKSSDSQYDYIASPNEQALRRLCYFDPTKQNSDIHFTTGDSATPVLAPVSAECKPVARRCKAEEINGVIWPETEIGMSAKPRCNGEAAGLKLINNLNLERKCIFDSESKKGKFESDPGSSVYCMTAVSQKCRELISKDDPDLIWPETEVYDIAQPRCKGGNKVPNNPGNTMSCRLNSITNIAEFIPTTITDTPTKCVNETNNKCKELIDKDVIWPEISLYHSTHPRCRLSNMVLDNPNNVERRCIEENGSVKAIFYPNQPTVRCIPKRDIIGVCEEMTDTQGVTWNRTEVNLSAKPICKGNKVPSSVYAFRRCLQSREFGVVNVPVSCIEEEKQKKRCNEQIQEIKADRVIWPSASLGSKSYGLCEGLKSSIYGWPKKICQQGVLNDEFNDSNLRLQCVDVPLIVRSLTDGVQCGNFSPVHGNEIRCSVLPDEPSDSSKQLEIVKIEVYLVKGLQEESIAYQIHSGAALQNLNIPDYYDYFVVLSSVYQKDGFNYINVNGTDVLNDTKFFGLPRPRDYQELYKNDRTFSIKISPSERGNSNTNPNIIEIKFKNRLKKGDDFFVHLATKNHYLQHTPS